VRFHVFFFVKLSAISLLASGVSGRVAAVVGDEVDVDGGATGVVEIANLHSFLYPKVLENGDFRSALSELGA
jgi:hypothetical protein